MITKLKIADYITLSNMVAGLLSIYTAFNGYITLAALLIIFGVVLDKADGSVARVLKQESKLGVQLDSFADLVTFGVAPAALLTNAFGIAWLSVLSMLLPIAGAMRLGRFNIEKKSKEKHFVGTPITLNGIIFPIVLFLGATEYFFAFVVLLMSYLMISNIKVKRLF